MMKHKLAAIAAFIWVNALIAQPVQVKDSTAIHKNLPTVQLFTIDEGVVSFMPEVSGMMIMAAKKNSLVNVQHSNGNKSANNMREILSRVPGIHVWESDAGGVQPGIATRGLSPNRSWEFNVRQDGFDIAADPFGYPEAYYQPPATAVSEIEITRGTAALQYGPQFGGLINYKLKNCNQLKSAMDVEAEQSYSTAGLFNSFVGLGIKERKYNAYAFVNHKSGKGWRENSRLNNNTIYADFSFRLSPRWTISPTFTFFQLLSQQPGGLTDSILYSRPQTSWRSRNWMGIEWLVPGITINYQKDSNLVWESKLSAIYSKRNSISFNQPITIADTMDVATKQFANRTLQLDTYRNLQFESRLKKTVLLGNRKQMIAIGLRYFNGNTHRLGEGKGSAGTDYDIDALGPFNKDFDFHSENMALFTENIISINERLLFTTGIRAETIKATVSGRNGFTSGIPVMLLPQQKNRTFFLMGAGFEYHLNKYQEIYGSITQCYRPVLFSHLLSPPGNDKIDPDLQDSKGYVVDLGYRSKPKKGLMYDVSIYYLKYADKVGTIIQQQPGLSYRFLTNIGDSYSAGLESFAEWKKKRKIKHWIGEWGVFLSYSYNQSRYSKNNKEKTLNGKWVENAPKHILRMGIDISISKCAFGYQVSYTDKCYSDASNSILPSANAQAGIIPSYTLMDIYGIYDFGNKIKLKAGINNLTAQKYFTRRTGGLPGPGALPGDGRVVTFSFIKNWK